MENLRYSNDNIQPLWPAEFTNEVGVVQEKRYTSFLENETFVIEASRTPSQIQVRSTLARKDGSQIYPIEAVVRTNEIGEVSPQNVALQIIDYLDTYWNEYLTQGRDTWLTLDWSEHKVDAMTIYLRGFVRNLTAEAAAEKFLREHGLGGYDIEPIGGDK